MFSSPSCHFNDTTSSTISSQLTFSQSSGSSWSQQNLIPIGHDSNAKYPSSLLFNCRTIHPSSSLHEESNTNSRDSFCDNSNHDYLATPPTCSYRMPPLTFKKSLKQLPELQRATEKLFQLMKEKALNAGFSDSCLIRFTIDDILPKLEIKQRRFYVITNVLASFGHVSHISQLNLVWRNSEYLVHRAIAQLHTEAQRYVKVNQLRSLLANQTNAPESVNSSSSDKNFFIDINSKSVIDVPGDNQGYLSFDDISHPRWIVHHKRKAHTAATQRLLMICMMADNNHPVAFQMTRQCYDICRVLTAANILREVCPKRGGCTRRVTYYYNGPNLTGLSHRYPSLKPVDIIQANISKRSLSAKSSSANNTVDNKNSPQYKIFYSVVEPKDIVVDGEEISQSKVSKILSTFGISRSSVIANVSPNPSASDCTAVTQNITKMLHCKIPNGSVISSSGNQTGISISPANSDGNNIGTVTSSTNQKRKRKNSSDSGSTWRQLKLEELPIGSSICDMGVDTTSPNWLSFPETDGIWDDLIKADLDISFLDTTEPSVMDNPFSDHNSGAMSPISMETIEFSNERKVLTCLDNAPNLPENKENMRNLGEYFVLRPASHHSLRVLDTNVMHNFGQTSASHIYSSPDDNNAILEGLCHSSTSDAALPFPMMTQEREKLGGVLQANYRHLAHNSVESGASLSMKNVFSRNLCDSGD